MESRISKKIIRVKFNATPVIQFSLLYIHKGKKYSQDVILTDEISLYQLIDAIKRATVELIKQFKK